MKKFIELVRMRSFSLKAPDHTVELSALNEVAAVWHQTGSLAAYEMIVSALDSNNDEIRKCAEEILNRHSPRPISRAG